MTELSAWIAWLLIGVSVPPAELGELLDERGISAAQASELAMQRKDSKDGFVACTPGGDADAEERGKIIAKRTIAAIARMNVAGYEKISHAYEQAISSRSAGANSGNWLYVSSKVKTAVAGEETCVAYIPRPKEKR